MRARSSLRAKNFAAPVANNNNNNHHHHHATSSSSFGGKNNNHHLYTYDENDLVCTNNIMFDSRVCRGNTYAAPVLTEDQKRMREIKERKHLARLARKEEYRERVRIPIYLYNHWQYYFLTLYSVLNAIRTND